MDGITINVDWVYFLGIMGTLLVIAWHSGSKFSRIETSIKGIKDKINDMKSSIDQRIDDLRTDLNNVRVNAFESGSPIALTQKGQEVLGESGMKEYIDKNQDSLLALCKDKKETNPYEVQEHVFNMFTSYAFDDDFDDKLKRYAYEKGIPMDIIRRVGAIHFRDMCLAEFNMDAKALDEQKSTT